MSAKPLPHSNPHIPHWNARVPRRDGWYDAVLRAIDEEKRDGKDHWLSHFLFAKKVLREDVCMAGMLADAYKHRALTQEQMDGLIEDFTETAHLSAERAGRPLEP